MFSIVPVLDDLVSHSHSHSSPFYGRSLSLMDEFKNQLGVANEVKTIEDNPKQLVLAVNCDAFKPEEIKVTIKDNFIEICGNHEEKSDSSYSKRQFSRRYLLPQNAIQDQMNCSLSSSGVLKVTIPKNLTAVSDQPINIPIQFGK